MSSANAIMAAMGLNATAKLIYGFDLGEEARDFAEAQQGSTNPDGYVKTAWFDEEAYEPADDEEEPDLVERISQALYDAIPEAESRYYDLRPEEAVAEHYGVRLEVFGHYECGSWALAAFTVSSTGEPHVDPLELAARAVEQDWDGRLGRALAVLGITPLQTSARWMLTSYYG